MDFDDITFTEWQIDKIRVALGKYRIANASNGRLTPWSRVCDEIIYSDVNIDRYSEDDAELAFRPEALRRFATRVSILDLKRLKDLTRFLVHEGILSLEDMDESDIGLKKMLAAHEYLASTSDSAKCFLTIMEGTYTCRKKNKLGNWDTFTLRIMPDPSREFVRVEEIYEYSPEELTRYESYERKNLFTTLRIVQVGYGFSVTKDNFLHLFLGGGEPGVNIAYVQEGGAIFDRSADKESVVHIDLLRHGYRHLIDPEGKPFGEGADSLYFFNTARTYPDPD
ncbi:hypothetical protein [Pseudomonas fluorescens]|uniref:Uncharacterized protein n=1 Tax=Pseudomonas fluorescens TaxID=294 RepID=A0A5E7ASZ1_PSEFL|nr:hypothetical protein [Pseudomonas fluorescens]VVN79677.1 hypothetical protein PS691_00993 [Pseudomonas fluorescens]